MSYNPSGYPGYPPQGGNPQGYPPPGGYQGGYPPQGGNPQGYPPQGSNSGYPGQYGYPPQGYSPQGGYPGQQPGGYPGQQGPQGGYPGQQPGGYPGQQPGGYPGQQGPPGAGGQPGSHASPYPVPQNVSNQWYSQYYNQINPQEMHRLTAWFHSVDRDRSGHIDANELATSIWPGGKQFDRQTINKFLAVFDEDRSGTMSFYEYAALYKYVETLTTAFWYCDRDRSMTLDANELPTALQQAGYPLDVETTNLLKKKYAKTPGAGKTGGPGSISGAGTGQVTFENYVRICVSLAHMNSVFRKHDRGTNSITLDKANFYKVCLSLMD